MAAANDTASAGKPLVSDLANAERMARLPKWLNLDIPDPKGFDGLCVGRDDELKAIHTYFLTQYRKEEAGMLRRDDCVACIIASAPGGGKTTLREKFMHEAWGRGIACIELTTGELLDDRMLRDAVIRYARVRPREGEEQDEGRAEGIRRRLDKLCRGIKKRGKEIASLSVNVGLTALTGPGIGPVAGFLTGVLLEKKNKLADALVAEMEAHGVEMDGVTSLKILSATHDGDYLLTVDEAQMWGDQRLTADRLQNTLPLVCSPSARKANDIKGGGLLLSGFGNVKDNLDGLGLSRAKVIWIGELEERYTKQIVEHAINQLGDKHLPQERRDRIKKCWPDAISRTFTGWPQHTALAGELAKMAVLQTQKSSEAMDDRLLEWIITGTADRITDLYTTQLSSATDEVDDRVPLAVLTLAGLTDGLMDKGSVHRIIEETRQRKGLPFDKVAVRADLSVLKRTGIIRDDRVKDRSGIKRDLYRVGLPSIRTYAMAAATEGERWEAMELAKDALKSAPDAPP